MIASSQIRSARHALRWNVSELAKLSGMSTSPIKRIEASDGPPNSTEVNIAALQSTLESAGIEFIGTHDDGSGIRIRIRTASPKP